MHEEVPAGAGIASADHPAAPRLLSAPPRLLFVPVSGRSGMGEYARSRALARGALGRWPEARIHFLLSREAAYAAQSEFESTLLPSSPTHHSGAVIEAMRGFRPDVVVFDNAGRTAQLAAAVRLGARLVYISARSRQRRKAFRWRWMGMLDEHWIAYPQFLAGPLSGIERLKLSLRGRPRLRYLDVLLAADDPAAAAAFMHRHGLEPGQFVLIVPGAGTVHAGAENANAVFARAAEILSAQGLACVLIAPLGAAASAAGNLLARVERQDPLLLHALMRRAALVITNGGGTLLQALGCGAATLAMPIAKDQDARIRRCAALGVALQVNANPEHIAVAARALLSDRVALQALQAKARALALADSTAGAVCALESLLSAAQPPRGEPR